MYKFIEKLRNTINYKNITTIKNTTIINNIVEVKNKIKNKIIKIYDYKDTNIYILLFFALYNTQFIFDLAYKSYQLEFLKSVETNVNVNYFLLFNFFHFILIFFRICEKHINIICLEQPIKQYIFYDTFEKIKIMPKNWLECNSQKKIDLIINNAQSSFYNRYNTFFELYGSIIRVLMNMYVLHTMDGSLKLILLYFIFYTAFYNYIILKSRDYVKNNNSKKNVYELLNKNLYLNYFNSVIGNYQDTYICNINNNNNIINKFNLSNQVVDKIYLGSLQLFHKSILCLYMYDYITKNCSIKCSLFLLPLYQTTLTLVYQYEYMLHNYYGIINQDFTNYDNFINEYENNKVIRYRNTINLFTLHYKLNYANKKQLIINTNLLINNNDKILLQGASGAGKSSLCKITSDYFNDFITQQKILYIPQEIYLYFENRTLYNIITENDINLYYDSVDIFNYVIHNLIPFDDIISSFENNNINCNLDGKSFSGGQEKRIYLAKWLYYLIVNTDKYDVLILDEPDKSLDNNTVNQMLYNILTNKILNRLCIVIVSHNIDTQLHSLFNKFIDVKNIDNNIELVNRIRYR